MLLDLHLIIIKAKWTWAQNWNTAEDTYCAHIRNISVHKGTRGSGLAGDNVCRILTGPMARYLRMFRYSWVLGLHPMVNTCS